MRTSFTSNLRQLAATAGIATVAGLAAWAPPAAAQAADARADRVQARGLDIYYEVHGDLSPDDPPILLLHGGMGSIGSDFGQLLPALARSHAVIGIEQQGHGRTGGRDEPFSLASMRADTLAVLDALEVTQVHAIGFSMGGMLALDLAVHAPNRVATLTALSASQNVHGMHPDIVQMNRDPSYQPPPEIAALLPGEEEFASMKAAFADNPSGPGQFDRTMQAMMTFINSDWGWTDAQLATIDAPTLLVMGDRDFMPVAHTASMAARIPHAQLAVLPDTTHLTITGRVDWLVPMIHNRISAVVPEGSDGQR